MQPVSITAYTLTSSLGEGRKANFAAISDGVSGLRKNNFDTCELNTWIGRVDAVEDVAVPRALAVFKCRNNQLASMGLEQDGFLESVASVRSRYGANRVALIVGTSTSGVHETELAYQRRDSDDNLPSDYCFTGTHASYSLADYLCSLLQLSGPSMVISTACSSSAKVFATAERYLRANLCDAVVVGGVDSLCLTTLYGFHSLQLVSAEKCKPFDVARDGISIGEAAGFAILQRSADAESNVSLIGYGESSDAYHMSSPHPEGDGAALAMLSALQIASVEAHEVDYINCHGTATPVNDMAEDKAIHKIFGGQTPASSTKGWTGHTLGAAGIAEAVLSLLCIENNFVPGTLNTEQTDSALQSNFVTKGFSSTVNNAISNSFGFGGTNCSLLFGSSNV